MPYSSLLRQFVACARAATCALALLAGCGGESGRAADAGAPDGGGCGEGYESVGAACAPVFEDCGENEVAILGGGCERVGLPADCWPGWLPTDDGGCEPILPDGDCPDGTMPIIGESECQPIGDCGDGTWGNLVTDADTIFVDGSCSGGDSDGTEVRPFASIQDGVDAAPFGGQVVVAAGEYAENVLIAGGLRIEGRCPSLVTIRGLLDDFPAVDALGPGSAPIEVRGVRVTGPAWCIGVESREGVVIEEVEASDCGRTGLYARWSEVTLRRAAVRGALHAGVEFERSIGLLEDVAIEDTRLDEAVGFGAGIAAVPTEAGPGSTVTVRRGLLARNEGTAVFLSGSAAEMEDMVVLDTLADAEGHYGRALQVQEDPQSKEPACVTLTRALLERNRSEAVYLFGSSAEIDEVSIRNTLPEKARGLFGIAVTIEDSAATGATSSLTLARSLLTGNRGSAVALWGGRATIEDSLVRDTLAEEDGRFGRGVSAAPHPATGGWPEVTLRRSVVAGNREIAVGLFGTAATIEDAAVRGTEPSDATGVAGYGVVLYPDGVTGDSPDAVVRRCAIDDNRELALLVSGVRATVEDVAVRRTLARAGGVYGDGVVVEPRGPSPGNVDLVRMLVEDSAHAGIFFYDAGGSLANSVARRNVFAVALEQGADPAIAGDNEYLDNERNDIAVGLGLEPAPPVEPLGE